VKERAEELFGRDKHEARTTKSSARLLKLYQALITDLS
jgi:hypothetical protein